jgi:DNA-binding response OmpR family regulator
MRNEAVRTISILVIDDDPAILQLEKKVLESAGYDVILATDGIYGMELFKEMKPDLVILGIKMPGPDGYQVLESIRQKSGVPVIMVTGIRQVGTMTKALNLGADDFVMKPFKPSELVARVAAKLRRAK